MKTKIGFIYLYLVLIASVTSCKDDKQLVEEKKAKMLALYKKHIESVCPEPDCKFLGFSSSDQEILSADLNKIEKEFIRRSAILKKEYSDSAKAMEHRFQELDSLLKTAKSKEESDKILSKYVELKLDVDQVKD